MKDRDEVKRLLSEWAVLDCLFREMKDGDVRAAIEARRSVLLDRIRELRVDMRRAA